VRILHVMPTLSAAYGGPAAAVVPMSEALARRGHDVEVVATDWQGLPPFSRAPDGVSMKVFSMSRPRTYVTSRGLGRHVWRHVPDVDVVHIHSIYLWHSAVAALAARRAGVPYVIRPHGTLTTYHVADKAPKKRVYEALVEWRNINNAAAMHYTSDREKAEAEAFGVRTPGWVIPLGIGHASGGTVEAATAEEHWPELDGRRAVVFLGRLVKKKQPHIAMEAFAAIADAFPDVDLVLAGPEDPAVAGPLRRTIAERGLQDRVRMPGLVVGDRKWSLLARAEAYVLPSLEENFGVATAEAMLAGTPAVVSTGVMLHETVAAQEAGLIADDAPQVAEALRTLLSDPGRARVMGENGRRVARTMTWPAVAERLEEMYSSLSL
jgi:glycosyltransferase involved in cell wall biosynthesis